MRLVIIIPVLFVVFVCSTKALMQLPPNTTVPALLVFGDSIVDAGNNNNISTIAKCNFRPYGQNFQGGLPTGRFSDGKIPSDIIAEELGLGELLPAYLDPTLKPEDLVKGATFASGATGFDPWTPRIAAVISLPDQLEYFKEYIEKVKGVVGQEKTNFILANALFLVVAGSDDIANTYFVLNARRLQYDVPSYTDLMADAASNFVQDLYNLGARRIGVFSAPPIGCVPAQRTLAGGYNRSCADKYNEAAELFNTKLTENLKSLAANHSDGKFVYVDIYNPLLDIIHHPQNYGFTVVDKGCCGTGALEVSILCNRVTPVTCTNVSDHVFWDSYHPTERAYRVLVMSLLNNYVHSFF